MKEPVAGNHQRLFAMLQHLLGLPALDLTAALNEATQRLVEALGCEKSDAFLLDEQTQTLVAVGTSDTPMGRRQKTLGLDRLPLANGGKAVEAFESRRTYATGDRDHDAGELRGIVDALGVRSQIDAPLEVGGALRGVLSVVSAVPRFFDEADVAFVEAVATWVGTLAHRAELIEALRKADRQKGRRAAAEEVVTVLAHDVRNHLNPLSGRLQLLRASAEQGGRVEDVRHADAALHSLGRLTRMTSELLDVSRLDRGLFVLHPAPLNLPALARETASALTTPAVDVSAAGAETLVIIADADRLRQALENVIGNAVKHSPQGQPVRVEVGPAGAEGEPRIVIDVVDRGPGVPSELLPHLFEHFTAGAGSTGLGLGLYLAHGIARAHGGSLEVKSTSAEGTRFRFVLPVGGPSPRSAGAGSAALLAGRTRAGRRQTAHSLQPVRCRNAPALDSSPDGGVQCAGRQPRGLSSMPLGEQASAVLAHVARAGAPFGCAAAATARRARMGVR